MKSKTPTALPPSWWVARLRVPRSRAGAATSPRPNKGKQGQAERRVARPAVVAPSRGVVQRQWLVLVCPADHASAQGQACVRLSRPGISEVYAARAADLVCLPLPPLLLGVCPSAQRIKEACHPCRALGLPGSIVVACPAGDQVQSEGPPLVPFVSADGPGGHDAGISGGCHRRYESGGSPRPRAISAGLGGRGDRARRISGANLRRRILGALPGPVGGCRGARAAVWPSMEGAPHRRGSGARAVPPGATASGRVRCPGRRPHRLSLARSPLGVSCLQPSRDGFSSELSGHRAAG